MENVVVYGAQKRYSPEKHYVFILEITRENEKGKKFLTASAANAVQGLTKL